MDIIVNGMKMTQVGPRDTVIEEFITPSMIARQRLLQEIYRSDLGFTYTIISGTAVRARELGFGVYSVTIDVVHEHEI